MEIWNLGRSNWTVVQQYEWESCWLRENKTLENLNIMLRVQKYCALGEKFQDERSKHMELKMLAMLDAGDQH